MLNNQKNRGPCVKQVVTAELVSPCGRRFTDTNWCGNPQEVCPREGLPTGQGYHLCRDICKQEGHAEVNVVKLAGKYAKGATIYLSGHYYACDHCQSFAKEHGVAEIKLIGE